MRNVYWYFASSTTASSGFVAPQGANGLLRREADGAVARWTSENAGAAVLDQSAQALAPEVVALQFSYFDGTEWLTDWDSDVRAGLPVAVEIALAMVDPSVPLPTQSFSFATPASEQPGYRVYRQLVHLPMGSPTTDPSTTSQTSGESSSSTSTSGGASSQGSQP